MILKAHETHKAQEVCEISQGGCSKFYKPSGARVLQLWGVIILLE